MAENNNTSITLRPQVTPDTWTMFEQIALTIHNSRKFGVNTKEEAAIKLLFCFENGLALTSANTGLYIVNGKMAVQSNIIAAQLRRHPDYDYKIARLDDEGCTIQILRRHGAQLEVEGEASFTKEDAIKAGMDNKDNYKGYPSDMYFARALSRAQRRYAPDIFGGPVYTPEDLNTGEVIETTWQQVSEPTPAAIAAPEPQPQLITLEELVTKYGAEAVMNANNGAIPGTDGEVAAIALKLEAGNG